MRRIMFIAFLIGFTLHGLFAFSEDTSSENPLKTTKKIAVNQDYKPKKKLTLEWIMGITKGTTDKAINISYYDFEANKDKDITVYVDAETEFLGVSSIKSINPGDDIEVSYTYMEDGRPLAKVVIVSSSPFDEK